MTFALRHYQEECVKAIQAELAAGKSTLVVAATGTGKTCIFAEVIRQWPGRVLVLAHRSELIWQSRDKIAAALGTDDGIAIEMAEHRGMSATRWGDIDVMIASVATLRQQNRLGDFERDDFDLIITDEGHHSVAQGYRRIYEYFTDAKLLGVTATPDRADEAALGAIYDTVAHQFDILEAIESGWLVPIDQRLITIDGLDFSRCRTTAGDLNGGDLERIMLDEENMQGVASAVMQECGGDKTLIFTASVAQASQLNDILNRHRPGCADWVHGKTPKDDRKRCNQRYRDGDFQFLVNCGIYLEGFDEPKIQTVVMARPTKSRPLAAQMIGRGSRVWPGVLDHLNDATPDERKQAIKHSPKPQLRVLDFVGNSGRHKLITTADVLGGEYPDEIVEMAKEKAMAGSVNVSEALAESEREHKEQQADRKRQAQLEIFKNLRAQASYRAEKVDPFAHAVDVLDIDTRREPGWHKGRRPSDKQRAFLKKAGVEANGLSFFQASTLIGKLIERRGENKASYKQAALLAKFGENTDVSFKDASEIIDEIAKNNWKPRESTVAALTQEAEPAPF